MKNTLTCIYKINKMISYWDNKITKIVMIKELKKKREKFKIKYW